jgi:hypothetical protein
MGKTLALLAAAALLTGCPSFTTMGTARTIPQGSTQLYVATGGVQLRDFRTTDAGALETIGLPQFEIGARHGVSDAVEVGGKIWFLGAELSSKIQLHRSGTPDSGIDVAIAPALSAYPFISRDSSGNDGSVLFAWAHLPLLVGINAPGGSQLVLGPRVSDLVAATGGRMTNVLWLGGSVGYAWKLGPTFRVLPEISVAYPVVVSDGLQTNADLAFGGVMIQGVVGFVFGG